jgi:glycosyltransferase involved in cell wall biosynthesis
LTHASEQELRRFDYLARRAPPITVIPTCADLDRFDVQGPLQRDPFVLGYVGSVGTWYLLDEMLRCFVELRRQAPGARLLIVNRGEHELIAGRAAAHDIESQELEIITASHREIPAVIRRMTAGMALYKDGYSRIACCPTKLGEYLGCGVPCIGSAAIGDVAEILEKRRVGIAVEGYSDDELNGVLDRVIELTGDRRTQERCRHAALKFFSLEGGIEAYASIYDALFDFNKVDA